MKLDSRGVDYIWGKPAGRGVGIYFIVYVIPINYFIMSMIE